MVVFPSRDVQVNLKIFQCGNIALVTIRFLDVAKLTPVSLLILCKLSYKIVGLQIINQYTFKDVRSKECYFTAYFNK
jgi:hypothetical protein